MCANDKPSLSTELEIAQTSPSTYLEAIAQFEAIRKPQVAKVTRYDVEVFHNYLCGLRGWDLWGSSEQVTTEHVATRHYGNGTFAQLRSLLTCLHTEKSVIAA
jgi:hypothetical protein